MAVTDEREKVVTQIFDVIQRIVVYHCSVGLGLGFEFGLWSSWVVVREQDGTRA